MITSNNAGNVVCMVKRARPVKPVTAWGLQTNMLYNKLEMLFHQFFNLLKNIKRSSKLEWCPHISSFDVIQFFSFSLKTSLYLIGQNGQNKLKENNIIVKYLSKMGLSEVSRDIIPPVAPRAKKKNIPARSFGCKSLALAFSSWIDESWHEIKIIMTLEPPSIFSYNKQTL